jgi:hypothetical protein
MALVQTDAVLERAVAGGFRILSAMRFAFLITVLKGILASASMDTHSHDPTSAGAAASRTSNR